MSESMTFADGKYTVINDNGQLTALRHGEPWNRDLTGDNLVYYMLVEALRLKQQRDDLLAATHLCLKALRHPTYHANHVIMAADDAASAVLTKLGDTE